MLSPEVNLLFRNMILTLKNTVQDQFYCQGHNIFLEIDQIWNIPVCPYAFRILYYSS